MAVVGVMRVLTVVLGLVSLKYVAVSFTETIKSSAPFFTVIFARLMLGEYTSPQARTTPPCSWRRRRHPRGALPTRAALRPHAATKSRRPSTWQVQLSLVPVVFGLALCSLTELSFNTIGFAAAVLNNCIDCVQNVFSKRLLSTHYNYVNLQFYTSAAALCIQTPFMVYNHWSSWESQTMTAQLAFALLLNGAVFHLQSVMAYAVMGLISPVSQSVANTLKRALLIWASILYFGNPMSAMSALGTVICISGVLSYNHARRHYPFRHAPAAPSRPTPRLVLPDEARSADIQLMPTGAAPNDAAPRGAGSESLPPSSPNSPTCRAV